VAEAVGMLNEAFRRKNLVPNLNWYFAGQFARLTELAKYKAEAEAAGIQVTSRWLGQDPSTGYAGGSDEAGAEFARRDLEDITEAGGFLFFAEDPTTGIPRGGRHVEFGFALATGKIIAVVGLKENVFHLLLPDRCFFATFAKWLKHEAAKVDGAQEAEHGVH